MAKVLCPRYCPVPYCEPVCPTNAIRVSDQKVEVIPALCIGCGLCRKNCITWSLDRPLEHKSVQWLMRDSKEPVAEAGSVAGGALLGYYVGRDWPRG